MRINVLLGQILLFLGGSMGSAVAAGHMFHLPVHQQTPSTGSSSGSDTLTSSNPSSPTGSGSNETSNPSGMNSGSNETSSPSGTNSSSDDTSSPTGTNTPTNTSSPTGTSSPAPTSTPTGTGTPTAAILAAASEALNASRSLWLSATATEGEGTGTQDDPIDVSTAAKFDAFWAAQFNDHASQGTDSALFTLLPGSYHTVTGIPMLPGWKLNGAGQDSTTIQGPSVVTYPSAESKIATFFSVITNPLGGSDCAVEHLTLDGNTLGQSTAVTSAFVMPAPGQSVAVSVLSTNNLATGKWVYIQDTAMTNGIQKWWGVAEVKAINGKQVILQNAENSLGGSVTGQTVAGSPTVLNVSSTANLVQNQSITSTAFPDSTTVNYVPSSNQVVLTHNATTTGAVTLNYAPVFTSNVSGIVLGTAHLFPYCSQDGIQHLYGHNMVVESVTVQDVGVPFYEGPAGIWLDSLAPGINGNNSIDSCTVKDFFGIFGWPIFFSSNNSTNSPAEQAEAGTYIEGSVTNNVVEGNGYYQGIGMFGVANTTFSGNNVTNCANPFFCDTGYNTGITITKNVFVGNNPMRVGAGCVYSNSTISDNTVTVNQSFCAGIAIVLNDQNITVTGNTVTGAEGTDHVTGIYVQGPGINDIIVSGNIIDSSLSNVASPEYGIESGNIDQNGNLVLVGLQNQN